MTPVQKRFLSSKIPLAWIMKNGIPAYQECTLSSIENFYILGIPKVSNQSDEIRWIGCDPATLKRIQFSLRIVDSMDDSSDMPLIQREIVRCSEMFAAQVEGSITVSKLDQLQKCCAVCICIDPPETHKNSISYYSIREKIPLGSAGESRQDYDMLSAVAIYLGGPDSEHYDGVLKLLDTLLNQDITIAEQQYILWKEFDIILETNGNLNNRSNFPYGYSGPLVEDLIEDQEKLLTHLDCIESLMETTDLSVKQAMNALSIPEEEHALYLSLLRKRK